MNRSFEPSAGINRVAFGANPRIEITAGAPLVTADPALIARCAAHPHLKEVTKKPSAANSPAKPVAASAAAPEVTS